MDLTSEIEDKKNKNSDQPTEIKRILEKIRINGISSLSLHEKTKFNQAIHKLHLEGRQKSEEFPKNELVKTLHISDDSVQFNQFDESRSKPDGGAKEIVKLDLKLDVMTKLKK
ncbi:MAG: hypothetical protein M0Q91_10260 [Methanoregula sp.]|jgi:hypothetical protein|nr:hypothetical protein [Methanoregula sp.]